MKAPEPFKNEPFIDIVKHRTSCRSYRRMPVPRESLELILEAARLSPSACNKQPWRFTVVEDEEVRFQLVEKALRPGIQMRWALNAGAIIALGMEKSVLVHRAGAQVSGVEYPLLDLGIAGEHMVLQAEELGLGTCWIGWINQRKVRKLVGWPRSIVPVSLISVGWPVAKDRKTRSRKKIEEIVRWI